MALFVQPSEWESRSALQAYLEANSPSPLIVGQDAEAPRCFYSFTPPNQGQSMRLGVWSSGLGPKPSLAVVGDGTLVVGHDQAVTWVRRGQRNETSVRLGGAFFEFIDLGDNDDLLVVHELGVLRIRPDGSTRWSVDTDLIQDWRFTPGGALLLTEMDRSGRTRIDVSVGRLSRNQ